MGWARFDDQYSDHPKVVRSGPMAELLDMRAVIYCARYETDGWLTREALARLGAGIPKVAQKAKALVDNGRWHAHDHACDECPEVFGDGFYVHGFLSYNPSSQAKDADRAAARERMRKARESKSAPRSSPEQKANERENEDRSSSNPVPSPSPLRNSSLQESHDAPAGPVDDDEKHLARQVLDRLADVRMDRRTDIRDRDRYRPVVVGELEREHGERLLRLIREHPLAPVDVLAGAIAGEPNSLHLYRAEASA